MEVTKDEQRELNDIFRKIAERDAFIEQQRQAAETLRRKEAEPPVTVWVVVDHYTERAWATKKVEVCGVYLTKREAEDDLRLRYEHVKGDIETKFFSDVLIFYDSIEELMHGFSILEAPILSTFANRGNFPKSNTNSPSWSGEDEKILVAISKALGCDTAEKILVNEGVTLMMAAGFLESLRPQPKADEDDGKFVKILVRKELAEQIQRLGDKIQAGQSSFIGAMNRQEQPEVDLEKEIKIWCKENVTGVRPIYTADSLIYGMLPSCARHFYELGRRASDEQSSVLACIEEFIEQLEDKK